MNLTTTLLLIISSWKFCELQTNIPVFVSIGNNPRGLAAWITLLALAIAVGDPYIHYCCEAVNIVLHYKSEYLMLRS